MTRTINKFAAAVIVALIVHSSASGEDAGELISRANSLADSGSKLVPLLDSFSERAAATSFGIIGSFGFRSEYSKLQESVSAPLLGSLELRREISRCIAVLRGNSTKMGYIQMIEPILLHLSQTSSDLQSSEQQLRFEIGARDTERLSKRAEGLAYLSLLATLLSSAIGVFSISPWLRARSVSKSGQDRPDSNRRLLHGPALGILLATLTLCATTYLAGPITKDTARWWGPLLLLAAGFNLAFLAKYVADTSASARIQAELLSNSRKPIVAPFLMTERNLGYSDVMHGHRFLIQSTRSPVHAKVLVNLNAQVNGQTVQVGPKYDGKEAWLVDCYKETLGHFEVETILGNVQPNGLAFGDIKGDRTTKGPLCDTKLTLRIQLRAKRWDAHDSEYEPCPEYSYEYDFDNELFRAMV